MLGRLCFAVGALDYFRPFTAPLFAWAWAAAVGTRGTARLPWSVFFPVAVHCRQRRRGGKGLCGEAAWGILGTCRCAGRVGGWECRRRCPLGHARWFSLELTRDPAPWAFGRGEPFKAIAALELFASLLSLMVFSPGWKKAVEGFGGHQWFHGQCGKRGGAEQTDDIEISFGGHVFRAG